ncbi:MAG: hypothetical protein ACRCYR_20005 [Phycicoccus sp.]
MVDHNVDHSTAGGFAVDSQAVLEHARLLAEHGTRLTGATLPGVPGDLPPTAAGRADTTEMISRWIELHQQAIRLQGERELRTGELTVRAMAGYDETAREAGARLGRAALDGPTHRVYEP